MAHNGSLLLLLQDSNVVLAHTYEYRQPSDERVRRHLAEEAAEGTTVALDMTSRYLGLIVVPGHHIVKMELEQFASQLPRWERGRERETTTPRRHLQSPVSMRCRFRSNDTLSIF